MKTIEQDGITYIYCYGKARGKPWTMIYYPENEYDEAKANKKKPTERQRMEAICDELWGKIVIEKWGNKCACCETKNTLNPHHIITRSNKRLRWDIENGICLCALHHTLSSTFSAHKRPDKFIAWLEKTHNKTYNSLKIKASLKPQKQDMKAIYIYLKSYRG